MTLMITKTNFEAAKSNSGLDKTLYYSIDKTRVGHILVARSNRGVCAILIGDGHKALEADLAARLPDAALAENRDALHEELAKIDRFITNPGDGLRLVLDPRGTPFQRRVWEKLRAISVGRTVTYRELAHLVSPLASPRAVAQACAANPIALAIPCHRVIRHDGQLGGYVWGVERKRALLSAEAAV
ncbi:methylated-DNA--[protein]-cysteine S-methyltransferase [Labrys neptuniae]